MDQPTVLVVEDEAVISKDIVTILKSLQYHPLCEVSNGDEAIRKAREYAPDVVLMDIHIPGTIDGAGAAAIIQNELDIPVIFVTSYADDVTIERVKAINPYGYVLKPFTERDLKVAIEIALSRKTAETTAKQKDYQKTTGNGDTKDGRSGHDYSSLPDIRTLFLENFFNDIVLLFYNNVEEKELVFSSFIERKIKDQGTLLFAYSLSKAHRKYFREMQQGTIRTCRMKAGETAPLKNALKEFLEHPDRVGSLPLRVLIDFSEKTEEQDIQNVVSLVIAIRKMGILASGIIALYVRTSDDFLLKNLSRNVPNVIITSGRGTIISCADYTFSLEHISFLPQPVVDAMVKKMLEPVVLSLLDTPVSGNDILHAIHERYNVTIPKARVYTLLYALEKRGYLATDITGKSKLYHPTESGNAYIRERISEFQSVFRHILAEIKSQEDSRP